MAVLHATPLYVGKVTSTSFVTVYTVPAGHRVILRSIVARNYHAGANILYARLDAGFALIAHPLTSSDTAGADWEWRPWLVMGPGQVLQLASLSSDGVSVAVSGSIYFE